MKLINRLFSFTVMLFGGLLLFGAPLSAATVFYDDFESGSLSQWTGRNGGAHHGDIVVDSMDPANHVLTFNQLNSGGDIFSVATFPSSVAPSFNLMLEDFFRPGASLAACALGCPGAVPGDVFFDNIRLETGVAADSYILSFNYFSDPTMGGTAGDLGGFIGYSYGTSDDFSLSGNPRFWIAGTSACCGGKLNTLSGIAPQDVLMDLGPGLLQRGSLPFTPVGVPEPGTLLLLGSGVVGLFTMRKQARLKTSLA